MVKAYIILAHKNPEQVFRMINRLADNSSSFFLHIDKKVSLKSVEFFFETKLKIILVDRVVTNWGGFGLVSATLNALRSVKQTGVRYDRVILLSGQDYPIKSNDYINSFFTQSPSSIFLEHFTIPADKWMPRGGMYRFDKYYFGAGIVKKYCAKIINFSARGINFLQRKFPATLQPFGGSQWWIIDMHALDYIVDYIAKNPWYVSFYKFSFAPDEVFFQTLLLNTKDEIILRSIFNANKHFFIWDDSGSAHPDILTKMDFAQVFSSDALFARKLDATVDTEIFDLIDQNCLT